jgi:urea transport system ATP-binding protein
MHGGKVLSEGTVSQIQADPRVQEVYLGRTADAELDPFSPPALTKEES